MGVNALAVVLMIAVFHHGRSRRPGGGDRRPAPGGGRQAAQGGVFGEDAVRRMASRHAATWRPGSGPCWTTARARSSTGSDELGRASHGGGAAHRRRPPRTEGGPVSPRTHTAPRSNGPPRPRHGHGHRGGPARTPPWSSRPADPRPCGPAGRALSADHTVVGLLARRGSGQSSLLRCGGGPGARPDGRPPAHHVSAAGCGVGGRGQPAPARLARRGGAPHGRPGAGVSSWGRRSRGGHRHRWCRCCSTSRLSTP
ncbi:hypothetical protein QJS66_00720 [Kocuria rhizophila]|nr:hypothetical protein QJS66_00720 [Kocuria rhizophila]